MHVELKGLRLMVTGGAGFIGSHLVDRLIAMDNSVIVCDNLDDYYVGKEKNIEHNYSNIRFNFVKGDILDFDSLCGAMRDVDAVFHMAAQPGVRYSLKNPQKTNTVNTAGTLNVLRAAFENRVRRVVYASTSSVYGEPLYTPVDEEHPTDPVSFYGASKLAAEKFCRIYNNVVGLPVVSLRYHTVYGPRQRPDMAIHRWTRQLFENEPPVIFGDGEQTRDFTYIDDAVDGTLRAAERGDVDGEVFNLGGGSNVSVNDTVGMLRALLGREDIEPIYEPPRPGDVRDTHADISKARRLLDYSPKVELREGMKKFVEWFKAHRPEAEPYPSGDRETASG